MPSPNSLYTTSFQYAHYYRYTHIQQKLQASYFTIYYLK